MRCFDIKLLNPIWKKKYFFLKKRASFETIEIEVSAPFWLFFFPNR